jgi:hypothetical protein
MLFGECDRTLRRRSVKWAPPVPRRGHARASVGRPVNAIARETRWWPLDDQRCP